MFSSMNVDSFYYSGSATGVLLIHGFTGSPGEVRPLGEYLAERGLSVSGPLLPGHGTRVEDLEETTWDDWSTTVREAYHGLENACDKVFIAGLSMGAILALDLALKEPTAAGLICYSAPVFLRAKTPRLISLLKYFRRYSEKNVPRVRNYETFHYDTYPIKPAATMLKEVPGIRKRLYEIKMPALIMQAAHDKTVAPHSAEYLYKNLGSEDKALHRMENSGHIMTLDIERESVALLTEEFIMRVSKGG